MFPISVKVVIIYCTPNLIEVASQKYLEILLGMHRLNCLFQFPKEGHREQIFIRL